MRLEELRRFVAEHDLHFISVEQLAQFRRTAAGTASAENSQATPVSLPEAANEASALVTQIGRSQLPTAHGVFQIVVFRDQQGLEHSALIKGDIGTALLLTHLNSEYLTGDAFASLLCDCGAQLHSAMQRIEEVGAGIILYLRQEGRGIGLGNKIRAYELQDEGLDTVDANHQLGFPTDARTYDVAAAMLHALGRNSIRLLTNNPDKHRALESMGITVTERVPLGAHAHNEGYLKTKADRMGHQFSQPSTPQHNE